MYTHTNIYAYMYKCVCTLSRVYTSDARQLCVCVCQHEAILIHVHVMRILANLCSHPPYRVLTCAMHLGCACARSTAAAHVVCGLHALLVNSLTRCPCRAGLLRWFAHTVCCAGEFALDRRSSISPVNCTAFRLCVFAFSFFSFSLLHVLCDGGAFTARD